MARIAFTKPARKKLAHAVAEIIESETGLKVSFTPSDLHADELAAALPDGTVTANGAIRWANFRVTPRGVMAHIAFRDPAFAAEECHGINPHSGKWNHYAFPSVEASPKDRAAIVTTHMRYVCGALRPR